jgi:hypothetical protein
MTALTRPEVTVTVMVVLTRERVRRSLLRMVWADMVTWGGWVGGVRVAGEKGMEERSWYQQSAISK